VRAHPLYPAARASLTAPPRRVRALFDSTSEGAVLIGFFAVGLAVLIACYLIGQAIHRVLHASPLGLAQGVLLIGLLTLFLHANPIHSRVPELIDDSALGPPLQKAVRVIADGVQAMFPNVKTTLEKLGIQTSSQVPPLIQKLNKEARDARDKINELIDAAQDSVVSPRPAVRGEMGEGSLATSGVQLATASSKAQKHKRGTWRQPVQRRSVSVGLLTSCVSPLTFRGLSGYLGFLSAFICGCIS